MNREKDLFLFPWSPFLFLNYLLSLPFFFLFFVIVLQIYILMIVIFLQEEIISFLLIPTNLSKFFETFLTEKNGKYIIK